MNKLKLIFLISFLLTGLSLSQHNTISGIILDSETNEGLFNVNVFLNGTTLGTVSNKSGEFLLSNISPGKYTLVISMIGYQVYKKDLIVNKNVELNIELNQTSYEIDEVSILDEEDEEWQEQFTLFKKTFLGTSNNSKYCEIENKEIIDFHYNKNEKLFYAKANDWLKIKNLALGYRLYFNLFEYKLSRSGAVKYSGEVRFEELNENENKEDFDWPQNRLKTFNGSIRHFLVSLKQNILEQEGFRTFETDSPSWDNLRDKQLFNIELNKNVSLFSEFENELYADTHVMVVYQNEPEEWRYYEFRKYSGSYLNKILEEQTSWFWLPYSYVSFDDFGVISSNASNIKLYGYWAWERVADILPFNYLP